MPAVKKKKASKKPPLPWYLLVLRGIVLFAFIPYVAIVILFAVFQRGLIYRPTVTGDLSVEKCGIADAARNVSIQAADGTTLKGWLLRASGTRSRKIKHPLVIYFPGNGGNRYGRLQDLQEYAGLDFDVLIFDYRGYGDSGGTPSEVALESDAKQIWKYAENELGYQASRIIVFGESLGGAVALSLWSADASSPPVPAAVILNSTFYSMSDMAAWHYPWLPLKSVLRDRWPSFERIGRVTAPVIAFHGTADTLVPFSQGQQLASRAGNGRLISIQDGTHNMIPVDKIGLELEEIRARIAAADLEAEEAEKKQTEESRES